MSRLILKSIRRDDTLPGLRPDIPIEVRFGDETIWGPFSLSPGRPIDFSSLPLPPDISSPIPSSPFNDSLQLQIFVHIFIDPSRLLIFPITPKSASIEAVAKEPDGETSLSTSGNEITYTLGYVVDANIVTITLALLIGIFNAIILFISRIMSLAVGYVRSLVLLLIEPFRRFETSKKE